VRIASTENASPAQHLPFGQVVGSSTPTALLKSGAFVSGS
jgi:hypothetical protein